MNVLILNTVALNGGDGAILIALLEALRQSLGTDVRVVVHEAQPEVAARYYPDITFRPTAWSALGRFPRSRLGDLRRRVTAKRLLLAARGGAVGALARHGLPEAAARCLDDYRWADVVVTTGGTYLVEHYGLTDRLLSFDLALAAGKPLIFYTQSMGPFRSSAARQEVRRVLSRAALVLLRDSLSREHVAGLGGRADHVHVVPDSVFTLADPARLAAAGEPRLPAPGPLRVAISVRDWRHFETRDSAGGMANYVDAVRTVAIHLVERHGAIVTFLSTCQGIPEYVHDDARLARSVVEQLPAHVRRAVTVDDGFHSTRQLLTRLSSFDFVIATRMHFAILALSAGVPVIPIAYEFKTRELFGTLGQARWVHDIERVEASALVSSIDALLADGDLARASLFAAVAEAHERALHANALLGECILRQMAADPAVLADDERELAALPE